MAAYSATTVCCCCVYIPTHISDCCRSSFDWNTAPYDMPDLFSKPGTPCNDYNGYCDVFQKCREVWKVQSENYQWKL
jgi:hypothetical protein